MSKQPIEINNFSLICRLFGNIFYRQPQDPVLAPALQWIKQDGVRSVWALVLDQQSEVAMKNLAVNWTLEQLVEDYQHLQASVDFNLSGYGIGLEDFLQFRHERAMPDVENADHVALLLLTSSWIEDQTGSIEAQQRLFQDFLLPCMGRFLGQIEAHAKTTFYRSIAQLCRDLLAAMADELEEEIQE
ncbi:molecular chaperone [Gallibacterium trehalosifermentans]|uniref:Molecular chaperone n=1 Tax=Gallibacterium trehalosifermentans TaxID=516935 RepID=A0ABV6H2L0_9PAST